MKEHNLKIWGVFFNAVVNGKKTFEIRKMDRDYQEGDFITLREWHNESRQYTGRECRVMITYIYRNGEYILNGYGVMGIKLVQNEEFVKDLTVVEKLYPDKIVQSLIKEYRNLDHQVQSDRFFRHHLTQELERFFHKLDPQGRRDLDKILNKLSLRGEYDL